MPRLTVVLPAKDADPYLRTTLHTLRTQVADPADLKVVMIDDGSSDETGDIMDAFAASWPAAQVIHNPVPRGLASARNQGLAEVEGDAFCFLDGDDWLEPGRYGVLVDKLHALDVDFVRTDHVTVTGTARRLVTAPYPWRERVADPRDAILPAAMPTMVDYPYAWAGMFHRRVIDEGLATFPEGLFTAEDRPWIWRLHLESERVAVVSAPHLMYRRGVSGSLTQIVDRRQLDVVPAFARSIEVVSRSEHADRFMPKLATMLFAVSAHHLHRARRMSPAVRRELTDGVRTLVERLPPDLVAATFATSSERRRRLMAPFVRAVTHS